MLESPPLYALAQNKKRAIIPKVITLLVLGMIFYLGILLNISLLEIIPSQETNAKLISLVVVILIIVIGIITTLLQAKKPYLFYRDRVIINKKNVSYTSISSLTPKQDLPDKIFHTYSLHLGQHFWIRHIPQQIKIEDYLQQLMQYSKKVQTPPKNSF